MYDFVWLTPLWIRFRYREELGDKWEVFDIIFSDTIDILRKERINWKRYLLIISENIMQLS